MSEVWVCIPHEEIEQPARCPWCWVRDLQQEKIALRDALEPFAEGSRRAKGKSAWASSYVCPTKYAIAEQALKRVEV